MNVPPSGRARERHTVPVKLALRVTGWVMNSKEAFERVGALRSTTGTYIRLCGIFCKLS